MRILFVTGEFPPMQGGVGDYTRELGLALHDLGCEVHVATSTQAGPVAGLTIHPIIENWGWGSWRALLDLVRRHQPDVVHIQYQAAAYAMHPAINLFPWRLQRTGARRPPTAVTGRPLTAVTYHDLKVPYLFPKAGPLRPWVVETLARHCDAAITTNREDFEALARRLGAAPALIPIGSNIAPQQPEHYERVAWRARWGVGPGDLLICFFGFINDRKGVDVLLRALQTLATDPPEGANPHLLFIGGQTGASDPTNVAYLAGIQALVTELGLEERVHWTGYVPDEEVSAGFWSSDVCALPFRDGVSFLHGTFHAALVHGLPIVTTQPPLDLPELIEGERILLVPPEDPQALVGAIQQLAANPDLRHRLGTGARALSQQFRWETIAADTLALYRSLRG